MGLWSGKKGRESCKNNAALTRLRSGKSSWVKHKGQVQAA